MRFLVTIILVSWTQLLTAQIDTIVVRDYASIIITTDEAGKTRPVTNYSNTDKAGFFLNEIPQGILRICNDQELYAWVDGRLILTIKGCVYIEPEDLFENTTKDSIYVSFNALPKFENFKCELVVFDEFQVHKDDITKARQVRNSFEEFCLVVIVLLLTGLGLFSAKFQGRLNFFVTRTFSLKASAYQFTNTSFFSRANIFMILLVCMTASFEIIYIDQKLNANILQPMSLSEYVIRWLTITLWLSGFFFAKRLITQAVSRLFQMPRLRDWQLFDLVNFSGYFVLLLFIIILWDFIIKGQGESWVNLYFSYYFIIVLLLFALWFIIKFVINSSYRKLLIISYLCATEIIPSILIMVWFLK